MGVKGLTSFVAARASWGTNVELLPADPFADEELEKLAPISLVVDAWALLYAIKTSGMLSGGDHKAIKAMTEQFVNSWRFFNLAPVFVFDGQCLFLLSL